MDQQGSSESIKVKMVNKEPLWRSSKARYKSQEHKQNRSIHRRIEMNGEPSLVETAVDDNEI
jgi:hypothetical protein